MSHAGHQLTERRHLLGMRELGLDERRFVTSVITTTTLLAPPRSSRMELRCTTNRATLPFLRKNGVPACEPRRFPGRFAKSPETQGGVKYESSA